MTIQTKIKLGRVTNPREHVQIANKIAELVTSGKTDGIKVYESECAIRTWDTLESANDWIAFINSITSPGPISAEVIES